MYIFLLLLILAYYLYTKRFEWYHTVNKPIFMTKEETSSFFKDDSDNYVKDMSDLDIRALKSKSKDDYTNKIIQDTRDFTSSEKSILIKACGEADSFFKSNKFKNEFPDINGELLSNLGWVLSKTEGRHYEAGYPHTRENIIFITPDVINHKEVTRIMIHEKVHVFERLYPNEVKKWMDKKGYKPYKKFKDYPMGRSNPDLNGIVYLDPEGNETLAQFKNHSPSGIDDSVYPGGKDWKYEHPYETLAYTIDYFYAGETF